jgi:hypothetical protein
MAAAEVTELQSEMRTNARTSDLSLTGCYVDSINPFPLGTRIRLQITHDNATFVAVGVVAYSQTSMGMGITFTEIEPNYRAILEKWIAALRRG